MSEERERDVVVVEHQAPRDGSSPPPGHMTVVRGRQDHPAAYARMGERFGEIIAPVMERFAEQIEGLARAIGESVAA